MITWNQFLESKNDACRICGRPKEGNTGDYYHEKNCEAKSIIKQMKTETDPKKIMMLKRALQSARYVGD